MSLNEVRVNGRTGLVHAARFRPPIYKDQTQKNPAIHQGQPDFHVNRQASVEADEVIGKGNDEQTVHQGKQKCVAVENLHLFRVHRIHLSFCFS